MIAFQDSKVIWWSKRMDNFYPAMQKVTMSACTRRSLKLKYFTKKQPKQKVTERKIIKWPENKTSGNKKGSNVHFLLSACLHLNE